MCLVTATYCKARTIIQTYTRLSSLFVVIVGVHQGSFFRLLFFCTVVIDEVTRATRTALLWEIFYADNDVSTGECLNRVV